MLSAVFKLMENWFCENYIVLKYPVKCHFVCISKNISDSELFKLNDLDLENCKNIEFLGVTIDKKLSFNSHIKIFYKEKGQKLKVL